MTAPRPVILAGATASGKSALALRIAERDGGCVINADAAQVYRCWRVLTARPDAADTARAPHALYGHVSCAERYSVGAWLRDLAPVLDDLRRHGRRPVIVGGTGLYLGALTEGLAAIPEIPAAVRAESAAVLRSGRIEQFRTDLALRDPATLAGIDQENPMRLQRAWEVLRATGRGLSDWQRTTGSALLPGDAALRIVVSVDKVLLGKAIESRFHRMLEDGALDECRAFLDAGHGRNLPSGRVLGARELLAHLAGTCTLDEAAAAAVTATRRFAKHQRTWLRNRMRNWHWLDPAAGDPLAAIPAA